MKKKYVIISVLVAILLIATICIVNNIFATTINKSGLVIVTDSNKEAIASNEHISVTNKIIESESTDKEIVLETTVTNIRKNPIDYPTENENEIVQIALVADTLNSDTSVSYASDVQNFIDLIQSNNINSKMSFSTTDEIVSEMGTDISQIKVDISTKLNEFSPFGAFSDGLESGLQSFSNDAENKVMVIFSCGFVDSISEVQEFANNNSDVNIIIVLIDQSNTNSYNSLKNLDNVTMYTGNSQSVNFTKPIEKLKEVFKNEIKNIVLQNLFTSDITNNFIIQDYDSGATLILGHKFTISSLVGKEEKTFKYKLVLRDPIDRNNMFKEFATNDVISVTYDGQTNSLQLEETPKIKIAERFKIKVKAINEENTIISEGVKFNVELIDTDGTVIYKNNNLETDENGLLEIDELAFSNPTGEITIKISEATIPQEYQATLRQEIKLDVGEFEVIDKTDKLNAKVLSNTTMSELNVEVITKKLSENARATVTMHFFKHDDVGNKLGNVEFSVQEVTDELGQEVNEDGINFEVVTDEDGEAKYTFTMTEMREYYFKVKETKTISGYELPDWDITYLLSIDEVEEQIYNSGSGTVVNGDYVYDWTEVDNGNKKVDVYFDFSNKEQATNSKWIQVIKENEDGENLDGAIYSMIVRYEDGGTKKIQEEIYTVAGQGHIISRPVQITGKTILEFNEIKAPKGYKLEEGKMQIVVLETENGIEVQESTLPETVKKPVVVDNERIAITFVDKASEETESNEKTSVTFNINKQDEYGNPLGGVLIKAVETDVGGNVLEDGATFFATTDENGQAQVRCNDIKVGESYFSIYETKTVPGHELITEEHPIKIKMTLRKRDEEVLVSYKLIDDANGAVSRFSVIAVKTAVNVKLNIVNKESHSKSANLQIIKIDELTNKVLPNASFEMKIKYKDKDENAFTEKIVQKIKTDDTGIVYIENPIELSERTVIELVETVAPSGYMLASGKIELLLEEVDGQIVVSSDHEKISNINTSNGVVSVNVMNEEKGEKYPLIIEISKTDEYENLLGNVQFDIVQVTDETGENVTENAEPKTIITDENGEGSESLLVETIGEAYIKIMERNTVPGFEQIQNNIIYRLNIEEVSGNYRNIGSMLASGQDNITSKIKIDNENHIVKLKLDIKNKENINEYRNVEIIKQNEDGDRLSNAQYAMMIKYPDKTTKKISDNIITNENGIYNISRPIEIQENVQIELRELTAPEGYKKVDKPQTITLLKENGIYVANYIGSESVKEVNIANDKITIILEDVKKGDDDETKEKDVSVGINITKVDEYENLLGNVSFNIVQVDQYGKEVVNGKKAENIKTDEDGNIDAKLILTTGQEYYFLIYETKTVPGHKLITEENAVILKIDLRTNQGKVYASGSEVISGAENIENIKIYSPKDTNNVKVNLTLKNKENHSEYKNIQIVKKDIDTGEYLSDTTFAVEMSYIDSESNEYTEIVTKELRTDSTGTVNIETPVEVSKYTSIKITEISAKSGYESINFTQEVALYKDGNDVIVTPVDSSEIQEIINEGNNVKIVIGNKKKTAIPEGNVSLSFAFSKKDTSDNKLGGVEFEILQTDSNGNILIEGKRVSGIVTNENGKATRSLLLDQIQDYYFMIYETRTVPGHKLISSSNPIRLKVTVGEKDGKLAIVDKKLISTGGDNNNIRIKTLKDSYCVKLDLKNEEEHTQGRNIEIRKFNEQKTQALSGAVFTAKIEYQDEMGNVYTEKIKDKLITDSSGKAMLKTETEISKLTTIELKEIIAPKGYEKNDVDKVYMYMDENGDVKLSSESGLITYFLYGNRIQFQIENKKSQTNPSPTPIASETPITPTPTQTPSATSSATPDEDSKKLKDSEYAIEIRKENSENSKLKVKEAEFELEIESKEANYYEKFEQLETNGSGKIYQKFESGTGKVTITVKETKSPKEYNINEETYKINVNIQRDEEGKITSITSEDTNADVKIGNKNKIIVTIKDEPKPQIAIVKEDKDDSEVKISGVYFNIQELNSDSELQNVEEIVTDGEGMALKYVGDKTNGTYYYIIEEPYVVEGYLQNNQQVKLKVTYVDGKINEPSVEIIEGKEIAVIKKILPNYVELAIKNEKESTEKNLFTLDVIKTDSNNINIRLTGAKLNVKVQNKKKTLVKEEYVDEDAKLRIEDIVGTGEFTISIEEIVSPLGRQLEGDAREIKLYVDPVTRAITYNYQEDVTIKIHQEERLVEIFLPNRQEKQFYTMVVKTINETSGNMLTSVPLEISLDGTEEKYMKLTDEYGQVVIKDIEMPTVPTTKTYTIKEYNLDNTVKREFKLYMVFNYDTDGKTIIVDTEQTRLLNNTTEKIEDIDKQYVEVVIPTRQDYYEIEILKKDENGNLLPGVTYNIKVNEEENDYITDSEGKILLSNRKEEGKISLELKEISTVSGYELNGLTHYVTLIRNGEYENIQIVDYTNIEKIELYDNKIYIELKNEPIDQNSIYWTLELNKYGETNQEELKNIKFFIQGEELKEEGTIITNEHGKYIWQGIKVPKEQGEYKYIIQEKQSPDGYTKKEDIELIVKVEPNANGELEITKATTEVQGVEVNVANPNYVVVDIFDNKVNEEEAYTIKILKKDEKGEPLAGAIFSTIIKELQTIDEETRIETTDSKGEITIGPRGEKDVLLEIVELYAPEGYKPNGIMRYIKFTIDEETKEIIKGELLNIADEKVIIDNEKRIVQIIIDNEIKPEDYTPFTLKLTKANSRGELIGVAGFKISGPNIDNATVILNNGEYEWKWIEMPTVAGTYQYKIKEILTPSGYQSIPDELVLNLEFAYNGSGNIIIVGGRIDSVYVDLNNTYIKDGNKVTLRLVNYKIGEQIPNPIETSTPTQLPTSTPTVVPTGTPDVKPTSTPTVLPTGTPDVKPTNTPIVSPTGTPDVKPTNTPTVSPTGTPDAKPTNTPTVSPTGTPDVKPTSSIETPVITTTPTSGNINTGNNGSSNNSGKLPQTGKTTYITISTISVAIITGGIYLIRKYVLK